MSGTFYSTPPPGGTGGTFVEYIEFLADAPVGYYQLCVNLPVVNGIGTDAYGVSMEEGAVLKDGYNVLAGTPFAGTPPFGDCTNFFFPFDYRGPD